MRSFLTVTNSMGRPSAVAAPSDTVNVVALAPAVPRSVPVPPGAGIVLFSATGSFWARIGGAAVLPTGDRFDGGAPELNPVARIVTEGGSIGLVAAEPCTVCLAFYGGRP